MVRIMILTIATTLGLISCNGQVSNEGKPDNKKDTTNAVIKVNKEYDEKGNIMKYDSTYSYFYSNIENNIPLRDSIFNNFKSIFNQKYFFSNQPYFDDFFFEDTLLFYDFYKKDFFF